MSASERRQTANLMRINHAGEVAAQALYRGQALVARSGTLRNELLQAAEEENDHLAWCEMRLRELNGNRSVFSPVWYGGSFALGALAGLAGDKISLGFLAETERQVTSHLEDHLKRLPANDQRSRKIIAQMRDDEEIHSTHAIEQGAAELPKAVKSAMTVTAKIMTGLAGRI
jgi:ubiquinone biosynthesis monooxygenase Coq7